MTAIVLAGLLLLAGARVVPFARASGSFPTTDITDDFNRSSLGSNWSQGVLPGACESLPITSNRLTGQDGSCGGSVWWNAEEFSDSEPAESYFTIAGGPGFPGSWAQADARIQNPGTSSVNYYAVEYYSGVLDPWHIYIRKIVNGVATTLAHYVVSGGATGLGIRVSGSSPTVVEAWYRVSGVWTQVGSDYTDSSSPITGDGYIGIDLNDNAYTAVQLDDFGGGSPTSGDDGGGGGSTTLSQIGCHEVAVGLDSNCVSRTLADPVNTLTGAFTISVPDLTLPGPGPGLAFSRSYSSNSTDIGRLGQGWTDSYSTRLVIQESGDVDLHDEDGAVIHYAVQEGGAFVGETGSLSTLAYSGGQYQLVRRDQTVYTFNDDGVLQSVADRNGETVTMAYDGGNLATITDAVGRETDLSYDDSLLTEITMADGRHVSYDYTDGLLTSVTDATGQVWSYSYDSAGRLATIVDPLDHTVIANEYDSETGRVTSQTDAVDHTTTFEWDPETETATVTDANGHAWQDVYTDNVLTQETDPLSHTTTYTYDDNLNPATVSSPDSQTTTITHDSAGNLLTATAPASLGSAEKTFTYDDQNNVTSVTDANDVETDYDYDNGNLSTVTRGSDTIASYTYNSAGQPLTATDANNHTTSNTYDENGNLTSITDPLGNETDYTYDDAGRQLTAVDPLGTCSGCTPADHTTSYTYDDAGRVLTETDQLGHTTTYEYDDAGNQTSVTDGNGHQTAYEYDDANRLVTVTGPDPDGAGSLAAPVTSTAYDDVGNKLTTTDPDGNTTTYGYNDANQLTSFTTANDETTTYSYDDNGNLATSVDPRGNESGADPGDYTTSYTYDAAGRLLTTTDPLDHVTINTYDPVGNLASVTDANEHATSYTYDNAGRILTVTAPDNGETEYEYDSAGNMVSRTDANGHMTSYAYNDANERATVTSPIGQEWTYEYDSNGNLLTQVDANGNASETEGDGTTTYSYDRANRLTGIDYSDSTPDVTYSYDAAGNRTEMTDGATTDYTYDHLDRLTDVTRGSNSFDYSYDAAGNITSRSYPDSTTTDYTYDTDNRLASVTSSSHTTSYAYDAASNVTTTTLPAGNGYVETRTYDHAGRLTEVQNAKGATVLSDFAATLDPVGNPTEIDQTGAHTSTETLYYDENDRLWVVCYTCPDNPTNPEDAAVWEYDAVGNRVAELRADGEDVLITNYTYNDADQLTSSTAPDSTETDYTYDADGNQTSVGAAMFGYDLANRLITLANGTTTTDYSYDGDGNRLQASTGSGPSDKINYLWDANFGVPQIALERDGSNALLRRYLYGAKRISMYTGGVSYYYHYDTIGSVRDVTDPSGASQWTYSYEPFGAIRTVTNDSGTAPTNVMRFTGEYNDSTDLYHLRARQYDARTGRFTAPDPAPAAMGVQAYAYASDRPTVFVDPSGETFQPVEDGQDAAETTASRNTAFVCQGEQTGGDTMTSAVAADDLTFDEMGCMNSSDRRLAAELPVAQCTVRIRWNFVMADKIIGGVAKFWCIGAVTSLEGQFCIQHMEFFGGLHKYVPTGSGVCGGFSSLALGPYAAAKGVNARARRQCIPGEKSYRGKVNMRLTTDREKSYRLFGPIHRFEGC